MKQYAVLTNGNGNIITIVSYTNKTELHNKTRQAILENLNADEADITIEPVTEDITLERTIVVKQAMDGLEDGMPHEFYLTPSEVV